VPTSRLLREAEVPFTLGSVLVGCPTDEPLLVPCRKCVALLAKLNECDRGGRSSLGAPLQKALFNPQSTVAPLLR